LCFLCVSLNEVWQFIAVRTKEEALIVSMARNKKPFNAVADFENTMEIISE
jgi:valyl-tRNA synthetase